jgi:hypothetical protein
MYEIALDYQRNIKHIAQLPLERLNIKFDELNLSEKAWILDKNSNDKKLYVTIEHRGLKEPAQIYATLLNELKNVESVKYQNRLEKLKHEVELPESIYKTFEGICENINKKIGEIERLIVTPE